MDERNDAPAALRAVRVEPASDGAARPRVLSWCAASALHVAVALLLSWNL